MNQPHAADMLIRSALFAGISRPLAVEFAALAEIWVRNRNARLFTEGEHGERMFVVLSGRVKVTRRRRDGVDHVMSILGPGDYLGELALFDPGPMKATATVVGHATVAAFSTQVVTAWLGQSPEGSRLFLGVLARRVRQSNDSLDTFSRNYVPGRVALKLLELADRFGVQTAAGTRVEHGLTQGEFAQFVGASRESVNKALGRLAEAGLLTHEPGATVLRDREALRRRAE